VLDGARDLEVVSKQAQQQASSVGPSASTPYRWLPQAYKPARAWQLVREAEQRQADAAARLSAALSPSPSSSSSSPSSSIPRKRIVPLMGGFVTVETTTTTSPSSPPVVVAPARLPPPPRSSLILAHPDVNWWTQMEHMLALLRTAKELRSSSSAGADKTAAQAKADAYVARAAEAWRLLSEKFADPKTGAFHWGVDRETLKPNGPVSDAWKASYHSSRAMVNGLRALC
jgi:hypothetical protein